MLSQMLTEMFNDFEQKMLEYMAAHHAASLYEYHEPMQVTTDLLHFPTKISASELAKAFNITEDNAKSFFEQLEAKNIGKIEMYETTDRERIHAGNHIIKLSSIGNKTDDPDDRNATWLFAFNNKILQCEILKPTADLWKESLKQRNS